MLSGLACMYYQSPSLLEFQRRMEKKEQRNNLRSMFTVQSLPTDQGMRNIIDQAAIPNMMYTIAVKSYCTSSIQLSVK